MKPLLKSKKGGIPIISEVLTTFFAVTPKPILIGLFIFLITVIASFVIPSLLSLWGYSCVYENSELELYQVPLSGTFGKVGYEVNEYLRDFIGIGDYELPDNPFPENNKSFLRIPEECFTMQEINDTTMWGYTALCVNCTYITNFWTYVVSLGAGKDGNTICLSDGFYQPLSTFASTGAKKTCAKCSPPTPYYFNISNCISADNCYFTIEDPSLISLVGDDYEDTTYLERVKYLGGVKRDQDSTELINIQCDGSRQPQLYFFTIKIFDRTLWIILLIGTFLVQFGLLWYGLILR